VLEVKLEVKPTGRSGQNGYKAVAGSEAFARWQHYRYELRVVTLLWY